MRFLVPVLLIALSVLVSAQPPREITIRAGRLLDGRGGSQRNVVITVRDGKIAGVGRSAAKAPNDYSVPTDLPGVIDTHVHLLWHFGADGRFVSGRETPEDRVKPGIENARK